MYWTDIIDIQLIGISLMDSDIPQDIGLYQLQASTNRGFNFIRNQFCQQFQWKKPFQKCNVEFNKSYFHYIYIDIYSIELLAPVNLHQVRYLLQQFLIQLFRLFYFSHVTYL